MVIFNMMKKYSLNKKNILTGVIMKKSFYTHLLSITMLLLTSFGSTYAGGAIIPTGSGQADFLKAYKLIFNNSNNAYRFTSSTIDTLLFPKWGEYSIYWAKTGSNRGSFIIPDAVPSSYSSVSNTPYTNYDKNGASHYSIQFRSNAERIAIFRSGITRENKSVSWEALYFKSMFDSYLFDNIYYYIDEQRLASSAISGNTQLIIIPAFTLNGRNNKYYIDSIFRAVPNIKARFDEFLARGGTIYTEGNAVYFIEILGYLAPNAVNFDDYIDPDPNTSLIDVSFTGSNNPVGFTENAVDDELYTGSVPRVAAGSAEIIANTSGSRPAVFVLKGAQANGGRIVCNLGLPTVGGIAGLLDGSRQLQWSLNSILYAFSNYIDVTRSIYNELPDSISAGRNAVAFDRLDTFEIRLLIRNLSESAISGVKITESIRACFPFVDVVTSGVDYIINGQTLTLQNISIPANGEITITYRVRTTEPDNPVHSQIDKYISWATYIYASFSTIGYADDDGVHLYWQYRNYVDMMFAAKLAADTDLNWKNFLGLYYQPFKVFMIMENKERTAARQTKYIQYIPKDVPFYWTDNSINIPILKTPGGKYVDVLRGSNDQNNPEYDMDSDGKPDAWLDTASIYPKGYALEETSVYWLNPWEHLRTGDSLYYEDIDHDGVRAIDTNADGNVDIEESGDKIRVWKVTWDIGEVPGYQFYDPYSYFEIWVDPPDLVPMAAGIGKAYNQMDEDVAGQFYPYSPDIDNPNRADTSWTHWMERDSDGNVIQKQLIYQKIHNYEGFTFIDTAAVNYRLKPTDRCAGTVPQPHREFIAVLSLGG
ncbi:MAG: hypothetical protein QG635_144, partial [Bacteroidota bacterium]|nr:hypothetical protein [Bacteroidota bacterium]